MVLRVFIPKLQKQKCQEHGCLKFWFFDFQKHWSKLKLVFLILKNQITNSTRMWSRFWPFINAQVFCYQNCYDLLWEKLSYWSRKPFEIRGLRPRICKIFAITKAIYSNRERSEQIFWQNAFLTCSCRFLRSIKNN